MRPAWASTRSWEVDAREAEQVRAPELGLQVAERLHRVGVGDDEELEVLEPSGVSSASRDLEEVLDVGAGIAELDATADGPTAVGAEGSHSLSGEAHLGVLRRAMRGWAVVAGWLVAASSRVRSHVPRGRPAASAARAKRARSRGLTWISIRSVHEGHGVGTRVAPAAVGEGRRGSSDLRSDPLTIGPLSRLEITAVFPQTLGPLTSARRSRKPRCCRLLAGKASYPHHRTPISSPECRNPLAY